MAVTKDAKKQLWTAAKAPAGALAGQGTDKPAAGRVQYPAIDIFRMVAALLVVANHTSPLYSVNETADFVLTRVVARLAVPFFFMASGFFLAPRGGGVPAPAAVWRFCKKALAMYGAAILLYLPLNLYMGYFSQGGLPARLLRDIFFEGTLYHLWYFPAVALGVWVAWALRRFLGPKFGLAAAALLYLLGLFGDSWHGLMSGLPPLDAFYGAVFAVMGYTRNGLFFAPLFLLLGMALAGRQRQGGAMPAALGLACGLGAMAAEALLLRAEGGMRHDSMYLFLPLAAFCLFALLARDARAGEGKGREAVGAMLRRVSMLVYIIHLWVIVLVRGAAKAVGLGHLIIDISPVFYLCVTLGSLAAALALWWLGARWRRWRRRRAKTLATSRVWAETSEDALAHNLARLRALLPAGADVMPVLKAEAYGHGALWVAQAMRRRGAKGFAVATLEEGVALRRGGVWGTILVLGYTPPALARRIWLYGITQTAVDAAHARALAAQGVPVRVHLKVDTGMHRLGEPAAHVEEIAALYALPRLRVKGIYTHLGVADSHAPEDEAFTDGQTADFYGLVEQLKARGITPGDIHLQSSYGLLNRSGLPCRWARVGIALYGTLSDSADSVAADAGLRPVLALRGRVSSVRRVPAGEWVGYARAWRAPRDSLVATLAIGYADGIPRSYPGGRVLLRGVSVPVIGRISMDQMAVLADDVPDAAPGDVVTLIGRDGGEEITVGEVAARCGTLTNEILSRLGRRVARLPLPARRGE